MAAAQAMLDKLHEPLPGKGADSNAYTLGSIGPHNVVMACLPKGGIGNNNAAIVASNMLASFPSIKQRLMVGIGGGVPLGSLDIRLGDVVVGDKVVQYDLGKATPSHFQRTAVPTKPPPAMLTAVSKLIATHAQHPSLIPELTDQMLSKYPSMTKFRRPDIPDLLFQHHYKHEAQAVTCEECDKSMLVERSSRVNPYSVIHHGTIASGNAVIKDGVIRNNLASELQAICFEMETAGLGDSFPCLAIRGICDYSDSHKNKEWQEYAAAAAAAHAKELLLDIPGSSPAIPTSPSIPTGSPASLAGSSSPPKAQNDKHTINAITDPNGPSLQETRGWLLKSLFFDQIESRCITIKPAYSKTCEWFLDHSSFLDWQDSEKFNQHLGFLWICGKPGAGKSTIMKFILANMEKKWANNGSIAVIYFFFNARGVYLERSTEGMYRSLLYQIFDYFYDLQYLLDKYGRGLTTENEYRLASWTLDMLKDLYQSVVESLGRRQLICFIDALDECDEDQIRNMAEFFEELGEASLQQDTKPLTCFASRHYPHIELRSGTIRVTLEDLLGHSQDIEKYIQSKLRASGSIVAEQIKSLIRKKAAGVFMWVVLVIEILNKELQRGRIKDALKRLKELPPKLSDLFKDILRREDTNLDELLLCIQWILYAKRPLTYLELYFAIKAGLSHDLEFPDEWNPEYETPDIIRLFILSTSKGLAEVTGKNEMVQFIHESVRDFLVNDKGIEDLWPGQLYGFEARSHGRLKMCCLDYAHFSRSSPWHFKHIPGMPSPNSLSTWVESPLCLRSDLSRSYPFLEYATTNFFYHADSSSVSDEDKTLPDDFDFRRWLCIYNVCQRYASSQYDPRTTPRWIFRHQNHINLLREAAMMPGERGLVEDFVEDLVDDRLSRTGVKPKPPNLGGKTAVQRVVHYEGPKVARSDIREKTALETAVLNDDWDWVDFIITNSVKGVNERYPSGRTILSYAAEAGAHRIMTSLLHIEGIDHNLPDSHGETPLMWAIHGNRAGAIRRLLKCVETDINARNNLGEPALALAIRMRRRKVIRHLLSYPSLDVNICNLDGETALTLAVRMYRIESIQELLSCPNLDVNIRNHDGETALAVAARDGNFKAIKALLKVPSLDVNARCDNEETALMLAIRHNRVRATLELLKAPSVDVNTNSL